MIHRYIWVTDKGRPGARETDRAKALKESLQGYDVVISGDNHKPFEVEYAHGTKLFNCGCFQRRRADEIDHKPSVGLIRQSGAIERHYLDCSQDVFLSQDKLNKLKETRCLGIDLEDFVDELLVLKDKTIDLEYTALRFLADNRVDKDVAEAVKEAIEVGKSA